MTTNNGAMQFWQPLAIYSPHGQSPLYPARSVAVTKAPNNTLTGKSPRLKKVVKRQGTYIHPWLGMNLIIIVNDMVRSLMQSCCRGDSLRSSPQSVAEQCKEPPTIAT